jgi:hypothetical protein
VRPHGAGGRCKPGRSGTVIPHGVGVPPAPQACLTCPLHAWRNSSPSSWPSRCCHGAADERTGHLDCASLQMPCGPSRELRLPAARHATAVTRWPNPVGRPGTRSCRCETLINRDISAPSGEGEVVAWETSLGAVLLKGAGRPFPVRADMPGSLQADTLAFFPRTTQCGRSTACRWPEHTRTRPGDGGGRGLSPDSATTNASGPAGSLISVSLGGWSADRPLVGPTPGTRRG